MISAEFIEECIRFARDQQETRSSAYNATISLPSTESGFSDHGSSATSYVPDPHAVSKAEAEFYYAGLPSAPTLIYRTGKEQWIPPIGFEAHRRLKELRPVFGHLINKVWNDNLSWKVVDVLETHKVSLMSIIS